jgi:hypothetical protein
VKLGVDGGHGQEISRWMDASPQGSRCEEPSGTVRVTGVTGRVLPKQGSRHLQEVAGDDPAS